MFERRWDSSDERLPRGRGDLMSGLVQECVAQILTALTLGYSKDDLLLLINKADLHAIASQEPDFFKAIKTLTGADMFFMEIPIKILGTKSAPILVRRIC